MLSTVSAEPAAHDEAPMIGVAADTVGRLLDAASQAFSKRGFHATTTRDIASRAGLSPAGVYVHFSTKEALLFALSYRGHQRALATVSTAVASGSTPTESLRAVLATFSAWHAENYRMARIAQYEFPHLTPEHRQQVLSLRKQTDKLAQDLLAEGVRTGEFDVPDVATTALVLMSMLVDVARWYSPTIRLTPEEIGQTYAELGLRMVSVR